MYARSGSRANGELCIALALEFDRAARRPEGHHFSLPHVVRDQDGIHPYGGPQHGVSSWQTISQRRADNMRLLAKDLAATGRLRSALSDSKAADIIWSMNSPEFYLLLVEQRGGSLEEYERWPGDAWIQLQLEP